MFVGVVLDYVLPFHGLVPGDPSFEDMKRLVVVERRQPDIPNEWQQDVVRPSVLFCKCVCVCVFVCL